MKKLKHKSKNKKKERRKLENEKKNKKKQKKRKKEENINTGHFEDGSLEASKVKRELLSPIFGNPFTHVQMWNDTLVYK